MAATLRTLLLSIPAVIALGALRPQSETSLVHRGVHPSRFWAEKATVRGSVDIALAGDSRVYRGIAPSEVRAALGADARKIANLGFSGVGFSGAYLGFIDGALAPSDGGPRVVVLGITPHSLTNHAANDNGYVAEVRRSNADRLERLYLAQAFDFVEPIAVDDVWRTFTKKAASTPEHVYTETFFADGWVASSLEPPTPDHALKEYEVVLGASKVDVASVDAVLLATARWTASRVHVVAFRPPVSAALHRLEDRLAGYDEAAFRDRFTKNGGDYIQFDDTRYETYDGSHLDEATARRFSRDLGARLAEHLPH